MSGLRPTAVTLWGAIGARGRLSGLPTGGRTTTTPFPPPHPAEKCGCYRFSRHTADQRWQRAPFKGDFVL